MVFGCWACNAGSLAPASLPSPTNGYILERAFWVDASAEATFEEARIQTYSPYYGIFSRGYSDSAHWIRLTVAASQKPLVLRITPPWLDHITLYDPTSPGAPVTVGDRHPAPSEAVLGLGHTLRLMPSAVPRNVWLRLQSASTHVLNAEIMTADQQPPLVIRQVFWAALYASVLLLIQFALLLIWWMQRDRVLGAYLLRHALYIYYGAAYLGLPTLLLSDWLPPVFFDQAFSLAATIIIPAGIWFDVLFLMGYKPRRYLLALLKLAALAGVGVVLVLLLGHTGLALRMNAFLLLVANVVMVLAALSSRPDPAVEQIMPQRVMIAYYLLIFSSLLTGMATLLGWIDIREWALYVLILHGLVSGLMMTSILVIRAQRIASHSRQLAWDLLVARQQRESEQLRRKEESRFLHMLMHEIKTPLSVISLALGIKTNRELNLERAGHAVHDILAILDRCMQADQLDQLATASSLQNVNVAMLVHQLAHNIPLLEPRLSISVEPGTPSVAADPQSLQIVLNNLLANAVKYGDPLSPIQVNVGPARQQDQDGLRVRFSNTPGLAGWPDEEKLFTKYYRAIGAQRTSDSGQGLYLSRQLAHSMGGALEYAPSPQTVVFALWMPLSPA